MQNISPTVTMIGLDILMVIYTLWVLSHFKPVGWKRIVIGVSMLVWLTVLHLGLSSQSIFPKISPASPFSWSFSLLLLLWAEYCCLSRQ